MRVISLSCICKQRMQGGGRRSRGEARGERERGKGMGGKREKGKGIRGKRERGKGMGEEGKREGHGGE